MRKPFAVVLSILLFFSPLVVEAEDLEPMHQEEIAEAPLPDPMSEDAKNYLLGEEMFQGTLSWQGNKVSSNLIKT